ncbi:MAG: GDP-mannose 4,6-dehydratase [Bacilli bacterium]|jgi:UDP-glucuronate 4-epimerase
MISIQKNNILTFLITGGSGFIGSSLADYLLSLGHRVINIDNMNDYYDVSIKEDNIKDALNSPAYRFYNLDICDFTEVDQVFNANKIDYIIHLAARAGVRPSIENPLLYQDANGFGTNVILEMAKKYQISKVVLASSSSVYGNNKKTPFAETDTVDFAISPYAASKKANEVLGHVYHKLYNIDMIFLRFFTVYGPRQRPDLAINKFMHLIDAGKPIQMFGDGTTARDYTYIGDIVSGIVKSVNYLMNHHEVYEIINLGNNHPISLLKMIKTIEEALAKNAVIEQLPMQPGDVDITYADISKANSLLGYSPTTSFDEGIRKFVVWYKSNKERNKWK